MAEVTLSPIPFGGGVLAPPLNRHVFRLSGDKYVALYSQTNPLYHIAQVFEVSGIKTNSPTINVLRTQVLTGLTLPTQQGSQNQMRGCALNNTDFVMEVTNTGTTSSAVYAVRVDPTTNVLSIVAGPTAAYTHIPNTIASSMWRISENEMLHVYTPAVSNSSGQFAITRLSFNPLTNTLTRSTPTLSPVVSNQFWTASHYSVSRDGTSGMLSLTVSGGASAFSTSSKVVHRYVVNLSTGAVTQMSSATIAADTSASCVQTTSSTTGFVFPTMDTYRTFTSSVTLGSQIKFVSMNPPTTGLPVISAQWMNPDYILLEGVAVSGEYNTSVFGTSGRHYRVVRYVDDTFIESTAGTTSNLILFNSTNTVIGFSISNADRVMYDSSTMLLFGHQTTAGNPFAIRVLHAPGA